MADPVLIAGAGPTGLTAALELSRFGIPVRIVDRLAEPARTSRAIGIQARTLELLETRGLSEEMVRLGNPGLAGSIYGGGTRVFRLDFTQIDSRYDYVLFLSQVETERILRGAIAKAGVKVERGVELVAISQDVLSHDASPVTAVLRHSDGRLEQTRTPWLISAEGAHSLVRTTLDLQFEGKTLAEDYALGDMLIDGELAASEFHIFSSEHGFLGLFPMSGRHFRLIASHPLSKPGADTAPALEELQAIYDQRSHIPARLHSLVWSSWFHVNSRMVPRLRVGRLLLGGDAAHTHRPAGAQGLNTGIQDMINLGWKLAFVMRGQSPAALLDTYEQDRLPVIRDVLTKTEALTEVVGSENRVVRSLLTHLGPWIGGAGIIQKNATARMSQIALGYRESPLSADHAHDGELRAGDRVPDFPVRTRADGGWRDEDLSALLDPLRFVLLIVRPAETETPSEKLTGAVQPWANAVIPIHITAAAEETPRARFQTAFGRTIGAFLVRPDGYLGLAAGEAAAAGHLQAYCRRWLTGSE
jgi:2-polyprenyl-6-methoxyphenol hydroxylase-like FAD-dependent oxidoreductase